MRGRVFWIAVVTLLLCGAAAWGWKVFQQPAQHAAARTLRVGFYDNPPKIFADANGHPDGLFVDLLNAVADNEGWQLDYRRCVWADCLRQLEAGQLDLMPDVTYTPERAQRFDFPNVPVANSWSQAYVRTDTPIRAISDLANKRIALLRDSIQETELRQLLGGLNIPWQPVLTDKYEDAFSAVQRRQADVAIANIYFGTRFARRYNLRDTPVILTPRMLFVVAAKGQHAHELARIDHWMSEWQQDPDSIYFQATQRALMPTADTLLPPWVRAAGIGIFVFIVMLTLFSFFLRWRVQTATADANRARHRLERVLEVSPVVLVLSHVRDDKLVVDWISPNAKRLYGLSPDAHTQPDWWSSHVHPEDLKTLEPELQLLQNHDSATREYRFLDTRGNTHYIHEELRKLPLDSDDHQRILSSWSDQSESRAHADALTHLAHHDALTGLPNRRLLQLYLSDAVAAGTPCGVLLMDLDRLRGINDTLGQTIGDQVLRATMQRLQSRLPNDGFLARHGGDEFAIVLHSSDGAEIEAFAQDILDSFTQPLLGTIPSTILTASLGIALHPFDGSDADTLIRHAELALYAAKRMGSGRRQFYDPSLSTGASQRLTLESGLRMALANRELRLFYQPQVNVRDGSLMGVEALLRWQHPDLGMVPPSQFIPVAEDAGMIVEIGNWVLIEACRQLRAWDDAGLHVPSMSVNCSVQQLDADRLPAQVANVLAVTGLAPDRLELEITESVLTHDPEQAISVLNALKTLGIRLAIDDFGTGYSSLAYLRRMPVSRLKIDRTFVSGIGRNANDEQICRTVISLAQNLKMEVLAEGVEHSHEAEFLSNEGEVLAQGYFYASALPPHQLATWLNGQLVTQAA